jgi:hypothetical protein
LADKTEALQQREIGYCIEISNSLHEKISHHVELLKRLDDRGYSRRRWALEAIKEQLHEEEHQVSDEDAQKKHVLSIAFPEHTHKRIEDKITAIKRFRKSYSKKKWILEALYSKLERDQQKLTKLIEEAQKLPTPTPEAPIADITKRYSCIAQNVEST